MITFCIICKQFFHGFSFQSHKCRLLQYGYQARLDNDRYVKKLDGKAEEVAEKYLLVKHELEIWNGHKGPEFEKLQIKTKRHRKIIFALLDGKSMKQAKKVAF